ncbi:class I SAM-dependent RNA methyltransferase [Corynebacterium sp. H113]|uniref:class I SAM-dependent RNA methyltransferase n=1 Tax=Corynebacterium sp. H113 TaxID=3133419 RepID=UPI0030A856AB
MTKQEPLITDVVIDRPAHGGEFIATIDGRIVLVRGGIPGEKVTIRIDNPAAKLWRGEVAAVIEPSDDRTDISCAAARAGAGCCDWDFIAPERAAQLKSLVLADALRRIGKCEESEVPEIVVTPLAPATQWRNRVRLGVDSEGRAGLRKMKSQDLIIGENCNQNMPGLLVGLDKSGACPADGELFAVLDKDGNRHLMHVVGKGRFKRRTVVEGNETSKHECRGVVFDVPVDGFWQGHINAVEYYADQIVSLLPELEGGRAWDLYGGVGVFANVLADLVGNDGEVVSVESFGAAAKSGREALAERPVRFVTGRVEAVVGSLAADKRAGGSAVDYVVLDPPRTGAGVKTIAAIAEAKPSRVVHVGCDPATFARDARAWLDKGYKLTNLEVVDAFAGTHHFETIALFTAAADA